MPISRPAVALKGILPRSIPKPIGLEVLLDGEPYEEQTHEEHHSMLPGDIGKAGEHPELVEVYGYEFAETH